MIIDFRPDGQVQSMHREDVLPLSFLGPQYIERATDIRYDFDTQSWGIWPSDGQGGFSSPPREAKGFPTYDQARKVEVSWLEKCRLLDRDPLSESGLLVLSMLRRVGY